MFWVVCSLLLRVTMIAVKPAISVTEVAFTVFAHGRTFRRIKIYKSSFRHVFMQALTVRSNILSCSAFFAPPQNSMMWACQQVQNQPWIRAVVLPLRVMLSPKLVKSVMKSLGSTLSWRIFCGNFRTFLGVCGRWACHGCDWERKQFTAMTSKSKKVRGLGCICFWAFLRTYHAVFLTRTGFWENEGMRRFEKMGMASLNEHTRRDSF